MTYILGLSAYYHDSAACLIHNGEIIAAAQEERFTRKKNDAHFPGHAIRFCLEQASIRPDQIAAIAYYEKPLLKLERILATSIEYAPSGLSSFLKAIPKSFRDKVLIKNLLSRELNKAFSFAEKNRIQWAKKLFFSDHHLSHAASAFFPSPFKSAAILTIDGVGEWATTSLGYGNENKIHLTHEIRFPHSLGLLYSAFTDYAGFKVNSGEYKLMGLSPYGQPKYTDLIYKHLIDIKDDGSFRMNMDYFNYCTDSTMSNSRFHKLFGGNPRQPESPLTQKEMDMARSIQDVTETIILRMARFARKITKEENLCLSGGVALNCVANGKILQENIFKNIWIQPAPGDAGSSLGAALAVWHHFFNKPRSVKSSSDAMKGSYLGPGFCNKTIEAYLKSNKIPHERLDEPVLASKVAGLLASGGIVGWFQDRMEFGPRSLGARSILGDPRDPKMQSKLNLKIKYRESFRPFAPAVIKERTNEFFELANTSPYMLLVAPVKKERCSLMEDNHKKLWGIDLLNVPRSDIPAVTHIDYSARVQTVDEACGGRFYKLLKAFEDKTGYPVLVNTSFNVRGEPIVCTPKDAYTCFMRTEMDYLVLGDYLIDKNAQPEYADKDWKNEFQLD